MRVRSSFFGILALTIATSNPVRAEWDHWAVKAFGPFDERGIGLYKVDSSDGSSELVGTRCDEDPGINTCYQQIGSGTYVDSATGKFFLENQVGDFISFDSETQIWSNEGSAWTSGFQGNYKRPNVEGSGDGGVKIQAGGTKIYERKSNGEIHIGENSLITIESNGVQELYAADGNGDAIPINITNQSDLQINGVSVDQRITTNTSNIDTNKTNITTNASNIDTNKTNITTNASNIDTNKTNITTNTSNIDTNKTNITTNASNIDTNKTNITTNASNIDTNKTNITTNASNIDTNKTNIATNASNIDTNKTNIATNASNIDTNKTNIATNASNIDTNKTNITTNASNIDTNKTNIATNTSNIDTNKTNIVTNASNIDTNKTNIATNASNIDTNKTNIATNASNIQANSRRITRNASGIQRNKDNINNLGYGVAGSTALTAALSSLPVASYDAPISCGIGTGGYSSRFAMGLGCAARLNERLSLNVGGSHVFGGTSDYGGGSLGTIAARGGFVFKLGTIHKTSNLDGAELQSQLDEVKQENASIREENKALIARLERLEAIALGHDSSVTNVSLK